MPASHLLAPWRTRLLLKNVVFLFEVVMRTGQMGFPASYPLRYITQWAVNAVAPLYYLMCVYHLSWTGIYINIITSLLLFFFGFAFSCAQGFMHTGSNLRVEGLKLSAPVCLICSSDTFIWHRRHLSCYSGNKIRVYMCLFAHVCSHMFS